MNFGGATLKEDSNALSCNDAIASSRLRAFVPSCSWCLGRVFVMFVWVRVFYFIPLILCHSRLHFFQRRAFEVSAARVKVPPAD